jgi:alkylhydroperoxidase/carboxymuconolactone decarboxylase family protein YurZ
MANRTRLPAAPPFEQIAEEERSDYRHVVERTARVHEPDGPASKYFGAVLNSPPLAAALVRLGTQVRRGQVRGTYTDAERELMDVALAVDLGSNAILVVHIPDALAVGVRPQAIRALLERSDDELTQDERQLVTLARDFVAGNVRAESYATLEKRFGKRGAVEFTVLLGFLVMTIRLWQALGVPDPSDGEVRELMQGLESGSIPVPDPSARIG